MNEKSELLDRIRFDVGRVPEKAYTLRDFYFGILVAIGKNLQHDYSTGLFLVKNNQFCLVGKIGNFGFLDVEKFGEGQLSLCAIRGQASVVETDYSRKLLCPFYSGHHLKGIIVISVPLHKYTVNEDDIIFLTELSRFIELKQEQYLKK